jgi:GMP synthase-like glutamine amidotransferase
MLIRLSSILASLSCKFVSHAPIPDDDLLIDYRGICYGCQELAWRINNSNVARGDAREYGETDLIIHKAGGHVDRLFEGLGDTLHGNNCITPR